MKPAKKMCFEKLHVWGLARRNAGSAWNRKYSFLLQTLLVQEAMRTPNEAPRERAEAFGKRWRGGRPSPMELIWKFGSFGGLLEATTRVEARGLGGFPM